MSSDIDARPDVSKKARYTRKVEEDGGEWEEREVVIYQSVDDIRHDPNGFQAQEGGTQSEKHPPVQKGPFRGATLLLSVLCLLLFAGIIALIIKHISVTLEKDQLKNKVSANNSQLQDEVKRLNTETHELKTNNSQLQDDVKRLNTETHVLKTTNSQLQDEVKRLNTETRVLKTNNSQLQNEVKKLKVIEGKLCPEGWKRFGCSCYFKSTQRKSWFESRTDCQSKGADLVTINNKEEQEFVRSLSMNEESWIGLENTWTSQRYEWKWVDGSPLTEPFWASGEPRYSYATCCNQQGKWTSIYYSSNKKNWICEKQISCSH
ncbi:low affinity immunoglobulin epsilon Fc receptor-like isoform X1 [Mugil cephalus]|uniref:low affinity immunoglobulin epsilon Fc receptor-like isoform X1 n=1 Tax=Mugil cephalus TaxID=48193 RepID=UPI001FB78425|nr:low affinity immunoglobulin epsilon Fc receptor-like isoform X1 [Mugil cephalus]